MIRLIHRIVVILLLVAMSQFATQHLRALDIEFAGREVKRQILALYDSSHEGPSHNSRIHKFAEMPLNHLGYSVVYQDVNGHQPPKAAHGQYRGILTWFIEPLLKPDKVIHWLDEATALGLKYVVLGEIAPNEPEALYPVIDRITARIGLHYTGEYVDLTFNTRVAHSDAEIIGFERPLDRVIPDYPVLTILSKDVTSHLTLESPSLAGKDTATVIATSPNGGFAAHSFTIFYEPSTDRERWTLNPFAFFAKAFGGERSSDRDAES